MIGWILLLLIAIFVCILLVRTLRFRPQPQQAYTPEPMILPEEKIVSDMADLIRCKTVSDPDPQRMDLAEYEKLHRLLQERFPLIHSRCTLHKPGLTGLLYHLPGKSASAPTVCMAHYDVVPADEAQWRKPPFDGIVEDGVLWGRGTLDTKGTLCGILEALEYLLQQGYVPEHDLYLSFSGEEEVSGSSCEEIVAYLEDNQIRPALVLDEGGAVVDHVFPGVPGQCAVVGIAEKGFVNLKFSMNAQGGHASTPPVHTLPGQLSQAVCRIEKHPFRRQLTRPAAEMFDTLGRHSTFFYRMIFANLWCFAPLLDWICKRSGGELNALMRTTVAVTKMEGSNAYNVLPTKSSFGANLRLLGTDTTESAAAYLKQIIKNDNIQVEIVNGMNPSICSDTTCDRWEILKSAIGQTWPQAIVSPYLMMACSDSRHYCRITDRVYRFSAMHLSKEERAMIHGNDERIPLPTLIKTVEFYVRLLNML